ncbi:hypothetical protein HYFRA_00012643 [Hymenoscyphus fraxineus]|uniref:Benzoate 4-monooxygenase cytochrome P450 n=1 Tax=Hymenoscyphus fraxineus TaxID=746836 RepID=A0A9N9L7G0_9HELO|nr:hypothetical protein HYFRA_00012643 [Hymenoscyphus fraxineus]
MESTYKLSAAARVAIPFSIAAITFLIVGIIRRIYFHPLSHIPGPLLAKISNYPYSRDFLSGRQPWRMLALHEKYGPVVRVSPNEVSFASAQSWQDIYAPRKGGEFLKSDWYENGSFGVHAIVSVRDPVEHAQMRKYLSRAFSEASLRDQEDMITDLIAKYVDGVGKTAKAEGVVNLTDWHNFLTFDIIGLLAFGKSFGGVESGKEHFWLSDVMGSIGHSNVMDTLKRFPWLGAVYLFFNKSWLKGVVEVANRHVSYTTKVMEERLSEKTDRKDFMHYLLRDHPQDDDSEKFRLQMTGHAADLVVAGSETTATTLSVVVHYLLEKPAVFKTVTEEILGRFEKEEDINATTAAPLKYLHAVCLEALRIFPPLPIGPPRNAPPEGAVVDGISIPGGTIVSTSPCAASMSPKNFHNPTEFIPERWLGENKDDILEATQPFSLGKRGCIGRNMAWLELHITLARLIFRYEIEREGQLDWIEATPMHLFWHKPNLMVRVKERIRK